jgi:Nuclear condensing complex subunits, C-term domain
MLIGLMADLLRTPATAEFLVAPAMLQLRHLMDSEQEYISRAMEVIRALRHPLRLITEKEQSEVLPIAVRVRQLLEERTALRPLRDQANVDGVEEEFRGISAQMEGMRESIEALLNKQRCREELREYLHMRCCTVTEALLNNTRENLSNPGIRDLLETVILPAITSTSSSARVAGLQVLGMYCLLDRVAATSNLFYFVQALNEQPLKLTDDTESQMDEEEAVQEAYSLQRTAMKCLFDFLMVFGHGQFGSDAPLPANKIAEDPTDVVMILQRRLDLDTHGCVRALATEGFAKLLFSDLLQSNEVGCGVEWDGDSLCCSV